MTYRLTNRSRKVLSFVLAIWFVSFFTFLKASHHHPYQRCDCGGSTRLCHIENTRHNVPDDASALTQGSVPSEPASSFSSICYVCLLLANHNSEHSVTPPSPILSNTKTVLDINKAVFFISSLDQSQDNPRAPPR